MIHSDNLNKRLWQTLAFRNRLKCGDAKTKKIAIDFKTNNFIMAMKTPNS